MPAEHNESDRPVVTRRRFARAAGAAGVSIGLAGCSDNPDGGNGDGTGDGNGGGNGNGNQGTTNGSSGSDEVTLVFNTSVAGEQWDAYLKALRDEGLPERINFELTSLPEENREQQWERWLTAGRSEPDLFMIKSTVGGPFMHRGQLQNISPLVSDETKQILGEQIPDTLVDFFKMDGNLYGVPFLFDFAVIQYRKDLVEQAGYDPSGWATNPLSWERFSEVMSDTADQTDVDHGYGWTAAERSRDQPFFEVMKSHGGAYWGDNEPAENIGERKATVDEAEAITALQTQLGLIYGDDYEHSLDGISKCAPESVLQWLDTPVVQNMSGGNLASAWNFTWSIPELGSEENFGEDFGVMPIPYGVEEGQGKYPPGGGSRTVAAAWHIAINPNSKKKEDAAKVLDAMVQENSQLTLFEVQGYAPPRSDLYTHDRIQEMDVIGRYADALNYAVNHVGGAPSLNPLWAGLKQRLNQQLGAAYRREKDPEAALSDVAQQWEDYESQNKDQF